MTRRILAVITLAALFNTLFTGCSKVVNLQMYQTNFENHHKIVGVTQKNGSEITFDERGGRYSRSGAIVSGTAPDGRRVEETLSDLSDIELVDLNSDQPIPMAVDVGYFHDWRQNVAPKNIVGVVTNQGAIHKFKFDNGRIDAQQKAVQGLSQQGTWISIPFDDVDHLRVKVSDGRKTAILVSGIITVLALASYWAWGYAWTHPDDDPYRDTWSH